MGQARPEDFATSRLQNHHTAFTCVASGKLRQQFSPIPKMGTKQADVTVV
jgi:hypothetical protein